MKRYIVKYHWRGEYDYILTKVFESMEEARDWLKGYQGIAMANEVYCTK